MGTKVILSYVIVKMIHMVFKYHKCMYVNCSFKQQAQQKKSIFAVIYYKVLRALLIQLL